MNSVWYTIRWKGITYKLVKISKLVLRKSLHSLKWLFYWLSMSLQIEWCSVHFIEKIEMVVEFLYMVPTCVWLPGATVVNPDPAGEYKMWHCTVPRCLLFWDVMWPSLIVTDILVRSIGPIIRGQEGTNRLSQNIGN